MNPTTYLTESNKTLGEQTEEQRTLTKPDIIGLLDSAWSGNLCDYYKRTVFYKDASAEDRLKQNDDRIRNQASVITNTVEDNVLVDQPTMDLYHAALGLNSESGEVTEAVASILAGEEPDNYNLKEEVGDILWYLAIICRRCNFTLEEAMQTNIDKLAARYPNKFTTEDAVNRNLEEERKVIEG